MKLSLYMDDYETERMFSYVRWIIAVTSVIIFYFPPLSDRIQYDTSLFPYLLIFSVTYMGVAQIALYRMEEDKRFSPLIAKFSIISDFIAYFGLLALTGGVESPGIPVAYLIIMHATIYWRTRGAVLSTCITLFGLSAMLLFGGVFHFDLMYRFFVDLFFICLVGLFGSLIVIRERKHILQKELLQEQMITDYLTGLYNHRYFQEQLRNMAGKSEPFIVVIGDIDFFKRINDRYGHLAGDEVLETIGKVFNRVADKYHGQAFRYGGEEFTFLLPDLGETGLRRFFQDLYQELDQQTFTSERLRITMSFGAAARQPYDSADHLLYNADQHLYQAKTAGKNRAIFDPGHSFINERDIS